MAWWEDAAAPVASAVGRGSAAIASGGLSELGNEALASQNMNPWKPISSGYKDIMDPGRNPADAGMDYLNKIPGQLHDIYDPYIQHGNDQYESLSGAYNNMANDPAAYLNNIMKGYTQSADYKNKFNEMSRAAGNTAAAGGMRGSMQDIQNESHLADSLMGQDMQSWLKNVLGIQGSGLEGKQNFYNQGYNAANSLGGDLSNVLGTKAQLAFQGQANQNQAKADERNMIVNAVTSILGIGSKFLK